MPRQFSKDVGDRLFDKRVKGSSEREEYIIAVAFLQVEIQAVEAQKRQIEKERIQGDETLEFLEALIIRMREATEELEGHMAYIHELQAFEELQLIVVEAHSKANQLVQMVAEEDSKLKRHKEAIQRLHERADRNERRLIKLRKWRDILKRIYLTMNMIEKWNMVADEAVSVQRFETENASEETDGESTTVEMVERKISSEVADGGSSAGTMEKVEESSTDGKLTRSGEKQSAEILPCKSNDEQLEVKQSSSEIDQGSIADRIEAQQELSEVAGRSTNEAIEMVERKISSEVAVGGSSAGTMEKVEEFSTDGKLTKSEKLSSKILPCKSSEKELEVKQSSSKIDQGSIADRIEAQQELSAVAGGSTNQAIKEFQISTVMDADRTRGMARLEKNSEILGRMRNFLGLSEEFSPDTDEKCKERLAKLSLQFEELEELFSVLATVRNEFSEL